MNKKILQTYVWKIGLTVCCALFAAMFAKASSHREAPLISNDPLADNTDVYAFRSPDEGSTNAAGKTVTIICDYIPFQLPDGGPNYYNFGQNIRYEIHIKNKTTTTLDDITYRFTFTNTNEDPTTFFNIRLGKQNLKTTYICQKSTDGGNTFTTIIGSGAVPPGTVPPNNIGPRSIDSAGIGLGMPYNMVMTNAIATASTGEKVFCGPIDDPFFVDLAGAFDVGNFRPEGNTTNPTKDGLTRFNVHTIALKIPVALLTAGAVDLTSSTSILDGNFIIGVWASASRQQIKTMTAGNAPTYTGNWVQVSRLGMPLTNEAVIPVGMKDKWNASNPNYNNNEAQFYPYLKNPELALYMDDSQFGGAVPSLNQLRIQTASLQSFDFRNNKPGLFAVRNTPAAVGTAFAEAPAGFGAVLLPDNHSPRAVDLLPIFNLGVPNLRPYQLASGKNGDPLAAGKPFINNFLPTGTDMLRLNMAVPPTPRNDPNFNSLGLVYAAVLGLTNSTYANNTAIQMIPNMDGFPNGRRLEDDVTTIELQAVSGVVLAAIGLWYDDYKPGVSPSPVTPALAGVLGFTAGPTHNDTTFKAAFPYVQSPWRGYDYTIQPKF